jgi:hypothetical protein
MGQASVLERFGALRASPKACRKFLILDCPVLSLILDCPVLSPGVVGPVLSRCCPMLPRVPPYPGFSLTRVLVYRRAPRMA